MQEELQKKSELWNFSIMLKYLIDLESPRVIRRTAEANLKELEAKVAEVEETEKNYKDECRRILRQIEDNMSESEDVQQATSPEVSNKELLDHLEKVSDDYLQNVDKIPMGEKLVRAREEELRQAAIGLEPWEINDVVQQALNNLPAGLEAHVGSLFDVLYEAVAEGVSRTTNQTQPPF
jgi:hypothetical protein